jgi:hypothetical protein
VEKVFGCAAYESVHNCRVQQMRRILNSQE